MRVILIGYRGSGKSVIGEGLARKLGMAFADADLEIERNAGRTISEIFAEGGETEFRRRERDVMETLLGEDHLVVAAGGGAVLHPETRQELVDANRVIWLTADPGVLAERISLDLSSSSRRPSLTSGDVLGEIAEVLNTREPIYRECATLEVSTENRSVEELIDEIANLLTGPDSRHES